VVVPDVPTAIEAIEAGLTSPDGRSRFRRALVDDLFFNPGTATAAAIRWLEARLLPSEALSDLLRVGSG
jgi:hypothetical protein